MMTSLLRACAVSPAAGEFSSGAVGGGEIYSVGGADVEDFDWQYLQGALVLLGAAGRCQRCFAAVEEVRYGTVCVTIVSGGRVWNALYLAHSRPTAGR